MLTTLAVFTSCRVKERLNVFEGGPRVTDVRQHNGFEEIEIKGSPTVYYTQADSFSVRVTGPQNYVDDILTEINGKTLVVRNRGKISVVNISFEGEDEVAVYVTSPDLVSLRLNGSGDFVSKRLIDSDNMDIVLRGSGDIDIDSLICDRCQVELVGSGDIDVNRLEAQRVSASLIGSGDIDLKLKKVQNTKLSLKGSGDIDAHFAEGCGTVDCELRGSGDISIKGPVGKVNSHKFGSGDINVQP